MTLIARADFDPAFSLCDLSCFRLERADLSLLFDPTSADAFNHIGGEAEGFTDDSHSRLSCHYR